MEVVSLQAHKGVRNASGDGVVGNVPEADDGQLAAVEQTSDAFLVRSVEGDQPRSTQITRDTVKLGGAEDNGKTAGIDRV